MPYEVKEFMQGGRSRYNPSYVIGEIQESEGMPFCVCMVW